MNESRRIGNDEAACGSGGGGGTTKQRREEINVVYVCNGHFFILIDENDNDFSSLRKVKGSEIFEEGKERKRERELDN